MIALVEPPIASRATIALSNDARGQDVARLQIVPHHLHDAAAAVRRPCASGRESTAGIDDAPGSVRPSVSAIAVIVEAVPIVMQCPGERAMPSSISRQSLSLILPARSSAQYFHDVAAAAERLAVPVAAQHRAGGHEDRRQVHADARP